MLDYELIVFFGVGGYMWSEVLTREGMIFGWWPALVQKLTRGECIGRNEYLELEYKRKQIRWAEKPLYECAICVTGFHFALFCSSAIYHGRMDLMVVVFHLLLAMLLTKILLRYA